MSMLKDRGYGVSDQMLDMNREQFKQRITNKADGSIDFQLLNHIFVKSDSINDKVPEDAQADNYDLMMKKIFITF